MVPPRCVCPRLEELESNNLDENRDARIDLPILRKKVNCYHQILFCGKVMQHRQDLAFHYVKQILMRVQNQVELTITQNL